MEARIGIICGLPARGIRPQLQTQPPQQAYEDQGSDVVELTRVEYRRAMGYMIRVQEEEEDIDPDFRQLMKNLKKEEQRLRNEELKKKGQRLRNEEGKTSAMKRPKQEEGESSKGKGPCRY